MLVFSRYFYPIRIFKSVYKLGRGGKIVEQLLQLLPDGKIVAAAVFLLVISPESLAVLLYALVSGYLVHNKARALEIISRALHKAFVRLVVFRFLRGGRRP